MRFLWLEGSRSMGMDELKLKGVGPADFNIKKSKNQYVWEGQGMKVRDGFLC